MEKNLELTSSIYNESNFENIALNIFKNIGVNVIAQPIIPEHPDRPRADLKLTIRDTVYLVEMKNYRSKNVSLNLISRAYIQLSSIAEYGDYKKILVIPSFLIPESRVAIEQKFQDLTLIDGYDLLTITENNIELQDKLKSFLPMDYFEQIYFETYYNRFIEEITQEITQNNKKYNLENIENEANKLIENLKKLETGIKEFKEYEKLCVNIINFLFKDATSNHAEQKISDDKLLRTDLICRINPTNEFWDFIVKDINSRYIIFEFKNYSDKIGQKEILTTERYLFNGALRKVAIIFSREGGNKSADKFRRGALRENGRVILILSDDDVKEMISMKKKNLDPTNLLFKKIDELFMTISR